MLIANTSLIAKAKERAIIASDSSHRMKMQSEDIRNGEMGIEGIAIFELLAVIFLVIGITDLIDHR